MHATFCLGELRGTPIEMRGVPVRPGGVPVRYEGKLGIIYEEAAETKAFHRWQQGRFHDVERDFASAWRAQLKAARHADMARLVKTALGIHATPRDLLEALAIAKQVASGEGQQYLNLKTAYALLGLPERLWGPIQARWKKAGRPPLQAYAPYTAHCLTVDTFFHVAADKKLISPERPSNRVDIAYLYYLPFCMAFVSNDNLHRRSAPLFLSAKQLFVSGKELKGDLSALDAYYWALSEVQREQGIFRLAAYPPNGDAFLTTRLWKELGFSVEPKQPIDPDSVPSEKILTLVNEMQSAARRVRGGSFGAIEFSNIQHMVIERRIPPKMGKWKTMPPGVKPDSE